MDNNLILAICSLLIILMNLAFLFYLGIRSKFISFITGYHWISLALMVLAGIIVAISMLLVANSKEDKFTINKQQIASIVTSIIISFLYWARFTLSISQDVTDSNK